MPQAVRVWGRYTSALMLVLVASSDPVTARELAFHVGLDSSRKVYPLLRYWIRRGIVRQQHIAPGVAVYSLDEKLRRNVRKALELYARIRPYELRLHRLEKIVEERLARRLHPVERELLALLLQLLMEGSSRYMRIRGSFTEALGKLADTLRRRLQKAGLTPQQIAQQLYKLRESLEELTEHHIIYMHYDGRNQTLVLAIDRSVEEELEAAKNLTG